MTTDETIIALLTEIRDLLKARPVVATTGQSKSGPTSSRLAGLPWADMEWPSFTDKKGKRKARTLGESTQSGYGQGDIAWWAANYEPKPYKGSISDKDIAFKAALVEADKFCKEHPLADSKSPSPTATRKNEPTAEQLANQSGAASTEDVPFQSLRDFAQ
jgi:hypothetical protein